MKKIIILIACITFSGSLMAQNDAISKFFSKYADDEAFTVVSVTGRAFALFSEINAEDPDEKEALEAISKLEGLRVLALEDSEMAMKIYQEALSLIPAKDYGELMTVRHEGQDFKFLIKETGSKISELLMVAGGKDEFFIISLVGDIDLNQISKLSGKMDIGGFEHFRHIDEDDNNKDKNRDKEKENKD